MSAPTRTARCGCGGLTATTTGDPVFVAMCSCTACQRRTGAAFGLSSYWEDAQVTITGEPKSFRRTSERGRWFEQKFCPTCGTVLWWLSEFQPGRIGIAVGCFADPGFPGPEIAVWNTTRHPWLDRLGELPTHDEQRY